MTDAIKRHTQRLGDLTCAIAVTCQQMKGHTLCRFRTHTGKAPQRLLETFDCG
jgi:hypothetical protein